MAYFFLLASLKPACTTNNKRESASVLVAPSHRPLMVEIIQVPSLSHHRNIIYGTTVNLTRMREITQDLAALFGLMLPVS